MPKSTVTARVLPGDELECQIVSDGGKSLTLTGVTTKVEPPDLDGTAALKRNVALVHNAWAFAKFTYDSVNLPTEKEQELAEKRARTHEKVAEWIADLVVDLTRDSKHGWCSCCFARTDHRKVDQPFGRLPAYLCWECGSPTLRCAGPGCDNMAARGRGAFRMPRFCAEHRHEIPGFDKAGEKMDSLADYEHFLEYEKPNLSRVGKLVGIGLAGIAAATPAAYFAAPAIGGAVGSLVGGYSGAVAVNSGLALLGGGAVAAGGLGMAGGTVVVTAVGAALGGTLGAYVTNAYVSEDKSFKIESLEKGQGPPVIVCNGFLSENGERWGEWEKIVRTRYPDSPVYRVHWGSKEMKDLGVLGSLEALRVAGAAKVKDAALAAMKVGGKRLGPLSYMFALADLARNPWSVAKNRADKTGVVVADLSARTTEDSYVLVGHSLGARVVAVAAQTLGAKVEGEDADPGPRVETAHLVGAAIGASGDWTTLIARVDDTVYNYHSTNDKVLKYLYTAATAGQKAAGSSGFTPCPPKLKNVDVSKRVDGHSDYFSKVTLK